MTSHHDDPSRADEPPDVGELPGLVTIRRYRARLGNHLAQYCLARRVAEDLGFDLLTPEIDGFPGAVSLGAAARRATPVDRRQNIVTHHEVDLASLLTDRRPRVIDLNGLFLRYEYFRPHKEVIRSNWLWTPPRPPLGPDDLTIHIRAGDVYPGPRFKGRLPPDYHTLPFSFYERVIGERSWSSIRIVSEDADDLMVRKLVARFGATPISGAVMDDFRLLRASSNLVLSVSSFSWWAAWLSEARRIYVPLAGLYDPERVAARVHPWRHDLFVRDEDRYLPIPVAVPKGDWTGTREERLRLLES
jgi:hypothetical protein